MPLFHFIIHLKVELPVVIYVLRYFHNTKSRIITLDLDLFLKLERRIFALFLSWYLHVPYYLV